MTWNPFKAKSLNNSFVMGKLQIHKSINKNHKNRVSELIENSNN